MNPPDPAPLIPFDWPAKRVIVTGGAGFLGAAVGRVLRARGVADERLFVPRSRDFDLTDRAMTRAMFDAARPDVVIHAAARVGGIQANRDQPGRFFHDNMAMSLNVIDEARLARERRQTGAWRGPEVVVQIGSMTSYPAGAPVPFREESLWTGYPDPDIAPYGLAKLAPAAMLDAYRKQYGLPSAYLIPVNLYGPGDNIDDVRNAHVAGSLVKRFVDAQRAGAPEVVCWGTGAPTREFLYVDDAAEAVVLAAERIREPAPVNLGTGTETSIKALAEMIADLAGYRGRIAWDSSKPDGQARRCLDVKRASDMLGWRASVGLREGLRRTVEWYLDQ